jgi:poly-gamma-glutamate synthesis protein (capsule biosynthesis protein)
MLEMLRLLDEEHIAHAGAGCNEVTAAEPAIMDVKGLRIGWMSFSDNEQEWQAKAGCEGILYLPVDVQDQNAEKLFELVRYTRERVNLLIVSAHWGGNWGYDPPPEHVKFAHALVSAGADIIFGHSAHVVRGVEIYHERPIIYSAGDFIDDYAVDPHQRNDQAFIFVIEVEGGIPMRLRLYPTVIEDCAARLALDFEASQIAGKMTERCAELGTTALWDTLERCLVIECLRRQARSSPEVKAAALLPSGEMGRTAGVEGAPIFDR